MTIKNYTIYKYIFYICLYLKKKKFNFVWVHNFVYYKKKIVYIIIVPIEYCIVPLSPY